MSINRLSKFLFAGFFIGVFFALAEYYVRIRIGETEPFFPLFIRGAFLGPVIIGSIVIFEAKLSKAFSQRPFLFSVLIKSGLYSVTITFWLVFTNGIWFLVNGGESFQAEMVDYLSDDMYVINLTYAFLGIFIVLSTSQISSLHRKGELISFILGRYHRPREVERIFCFIDLKGSTTIAERLGHQRFAAFLKDYYSDITDALRQTKAQVYQYVGDEIVLSWPMKIGLEANNCIHCAFRMQSILNELKDAYLDKYGFVPEFRTGIHGGKAIVTWVGEVKKEIVYVGDVLNTTKRIQERCKAVSTDFLISEDFLSRVENSDSFKADFVEEIALRGKGQKVRLYGISME